ncbi:Ldh family oxidoreductase [Kribbella sp. NPDC050124]|uniref:Ldh family oxidoreductase n=1 Tax=Kribbella sp. NPDC050124 TaxID=3364114 RepID=UPI0037AD5F06
METPDVVDLSRRELTALCEQALLGAGATSAQAAILAEATAQAELLGRRAVGLSHLLDYLDGFGTGRISATAVPKVEQRTTVISAIDCREGLAQHGFELALPGLCYAAAEHGLAVAALRRCFTAGELDYYVRTLNRQGLMGLAFANSPALMTVAGARGPLLGSNPLAFGIPLPDDRRLAVDQASSATAWVSLREAAMADAPIPAGWAVDSDGTPTTSASAGLDGALLPFGGYKGGNIALLVELLATLAGGLFSSDAPPFNSGTASPSVGVVIVAVAIATLDPGYADRLEAQLARWKTEHGADPGVWTTHDEAETCSVSREVYDQLRAFTPGRAGG